VTKLRRNVVPEVTMPSIRECGRSVLFGCFVTIAACHSDGEGLHPVPVDPGNGPDVPTTPPNIPGSYTPPVTGAVTAADAAPSEVLPPGVTTDGSAPPPVVTPPAAGNLPPAGNPTGQCALPADGMLEDVSKPTTVVGSGTPASCTSAAFVDAVAKGGVITFDCGPDPVTITLDRTAKIFNDTGPKIVIDGGNKVTLSGGGKVRILYMNTCDQAQVWTTNHCDNQDHPQLTVQNLTFVDASSKGAKLPGGGAIYAVGGRTKIVSSRFFRNSCDETGPITGGGALHVWAQFDKLPVIIAQSTFGGAPGLGNSCSNGGAINGLAVSMSIYNSLFTHNRATGKGLRTSPGGGSGGAFYDDASGTLGLTICGSSFSNNTANENGGALYFDSGAGSLSIVDSTFSANAAKGLETKGLPGLFITTKDPAIQNSKIE
jgi:predicted outer membrane repeat protein